MSIINTLPYNIANGQAIDAVPVMANFNEIVNDVNASAAKNAANSDITSLGGLTTPLSMPQGGTGDNGSAWSVAGIPTITAQTGTITTATGTVRYKIIGKTIFYRLSVSITNNGTGSGTLQINGLPFSLNAALAHMALGRENAVNGKVCCFIGSGSGGSILNYDNTYPGVNGALLIVNGVAELN